MIAISPIRAWYGRSLAAKLLVPIGGLMLASLLGATLAFLVGTRLTQQQLVTQRLERDLSAVEGALARQESNLATASRLLADDPAIATNLRQESADSLALLNSRAVVVRERYRLDLVQLYNAEGSARTNLVLAPLFRQSSLLPLAPRQEPQLLLLNGRMLLLSRSEVPGGAGSVVVGTDLTSELQRVVREYRLGAEAGLEAEGIAIGTAAGTTGEFPLRGADDAARSRAIVLGNRSLRLTVVETTGDIARVTSAGLAAMLISLSLSTLLLLALTVAAVRAIVRPIHELEEAVATLGRGDLTRRVAVPHSALRLGQGDEIGRLADSVNRMAAELSGLYNSLEERVERRTAQLAAAASVARATSASLEPDEVLRTAVEVVRERFHFYHVSIFEVEPTSNVAVLQHATGQPGAQLRANGHRLGVGSRSIVGQATATRRPHIVQDVTQESSYFANPALPDTRAEAAFPLLRGNEVLGALDVQSTQRHAFTPDIVETLSTLADQLAIALHNAHLYSETREVAEQLAELDRVKSQFIANMSHELRTPLNSIIGFSKVILKGIDGPVSEAQRRDLTMIHESGKHLLALINQILDHSRIEAGRMTLERQPTDLNALVRETVQSVAPQAEEKGLRLHIAPLPTLPPLLLDEVRIRQVLLNLLSNALKFTSDGQVRVALQAVEGISSKGELRPFAELSVQDTGIGIGPEDLGKLFRPFSQVDDSPTRRAGGTGLGLAICRSLVELHGGSIVVTSTLGHGSTFTVRLPSGAIPSPDTLDKVDHELSDPVLA